MKHYHKLITPFRRNHFGVAGREVTVLMSYFSARTRRGTRDGAEPHAQGTQFKAHWPQTAAGWQLLSTTTDIFRHPHLFSP